MTNPMIIEHFNTLIVQAWAKRADNKHNLNQWTKIKVNQRRKCVKKELLDKIMISENITCN
jgi:hypothetical protein